MSFVHISVISDVIAKQVRMGNGWYNAPYHEKPPFDLPVVYEDDHFAIGAYGSNKKYGTNLLCSHCLLRS
jgi:hypothetical protein